ncbi:MAG: CotH kinase family protein [Saprospiraceae bacterium]|nr:CotH kinase family protein [Saprospiraceae bacterium]
MNYASLFFGFILLVFLPTAKAQEFYDLDEIQTIRIYFSSSNWKQQMDTAKAGEEGYTLADSVILNQKRFLNCGVKFKGNSTYSVNRNKNPLHIKLDFVNSADYQGYDDIKLSNGWSDNSMIREPLAYFILRQYMNAPKSNFAKVYINNAYYGLMQNTEDIDKRFVIKNYLSSYNTFVKCNPESIGGSIGNGSNLEFLGFNKASYTSKYDVESDTGWSAFMDLLHSINQDFERFEQIVDIDKVIWMLAFNNVLVNLDSYSGSFRQNYFLYQNHHGIWIPTIWDLNMCFGGFATPGGITSVLTPATMQTMPFNLHRNESGWPLIFKLLNEPYYYKMYLAHMRTILNENFVQGQFKDLANQLHQMIDQEVKNDPNSLVAHDQFSRALTENTPGYNGAPASPGLFPLMDGRANYLRNVLSSTPPAIETPLVNSARSFMSTVTISARVTNATKVFLFYRNKLSDSFIKLEMKDDGMHGDGMANDQIYAESFLLNSATAQYYVYAENTNTGQFMPERAAHEFYSIDAITRSATAEDLAINEYQSSNNDIIYNEKANFADWIEIYNKSSDILSLEEISLSDDPSKNKKWNFGAGQYILPNEYKLVWADDENANYLDPHTNFKLGNNDAFLSMSHSGKIIYANTYGSIPSNKSLGRCPDGTGRFFILDRATPREKNACATDNENLQDILSVKIFPNPATSFLSIESEDPFLQTEIIDLAGKTLVNKTDQRTIPLQDFDSGIFLIKTTDSSGRASWFKFLKL